MPGKCLPLAAKFRTGVCTDSGFRKGPTDDLNFRKAVTLSLDYELLADAIGGEDAQVPGVGVIAPPNLGYDETLPKLEQNLEAAKAALDEGGYLDRKSVV